MVIRYDHIYPQRFCILRLGRRGYTAVDRDDKADIFRLERVERRTVKSVALFISVRDIRAAVQPLGAQIIRDKTCRRYAVHVIVTVDRDGFMRLYRAPRRASLRSCASSTANARA